MIDRWWTTMVNYITCQIIIRYLKPFFQVFFKWINKLQPMQTVLHVSGVNNSRSKVDGGLCWIITTLFLECNQMASQNDLSACVCVHMYVCMCVCVRVRALVCVHVYVYMYVRKLTHSCPPFQHLLSERRSLSGSTCWNLVVKTQRWVKLG